METFGVTFLLIFVTEIADKSRIVGFLLATTYRAPWAIFFGMTLAYALLEAVGVLLGVAVPNLLPGEWLQWLCGSLFVILGIAAIWLGAESEEQAKSWLGKFQKWGPFLVSFTAIAIAEIADRTQIAVAALTAKTGQIWAVYIGAMSALTLLNIITVCIGDRIARRFEPRTVHRFAGTCFVLFGCAMLLGRF